MTPEQVLEGHTARDLFRWVEFKKWELNNDKFNWMTAKLCYFLFCIPFRVWGSPVPDEISVETFLTKFKLDGEAEPAGDAVKANEEKLQVEIAKQKAMLMASPQAVAEKRKEFLEQSRKANKGAAGRSDGENRVPTRPDPGSPRRTRINANPKVVPLPVAPRKGQKPPPEA